MRRATYGVLLLIGFLIAALFVADGLGAPAPVAEPAPVVEIAVPALLATPSVPPVAVRIEEIDRAAALKLAANARSFMVGYEVIGPAEEVDEWAK